MTTQPSNTVGRVRNVGSNYTTFQYAGKTIAFLQSFTDSGQTFVGGGQPQFIHPLGYPHPVDIVAPRALGGGTITAQITELWGEEVWEQMQGLSGAKTIVEIVERLSRTPNYVTCTKLIRHPNGRRSGKIYHRCVITNVQDGDQVTIGSLAVQKNVTISYTHSTSL